MGTFEFLLQGIAVAAQPMNLLYALIGVTLGGWMCDVLDNINDEAVIERVKGKVLDICARFPVYA